MANAAVQAAKQTVWAVKIGDATVQLQDLPYKKLETVCAKNGTNPAWIIDLPLRDLRCAADLVELVALHLGVAVPFEPLDDEATLRELQRIHAEHLVMVDDDFPPSFEDMEHVGLVPPVAGQETQI